MPSSKSSKRLAPIYTPDKSNSTDQRVVGYLSSEQIDLFEHAALLYHGYEWQAAADAFDILSQNIDDIDERVKCHLNAGLIHARLGNYPQAATRFDEAAVLSPSLPIVNFLIALVSVEQKDYDRAETCIELCLDTLGQIGIDYTSTRLKFVLGRPALICALREIRTAQFKVRALDDRDAVVVRMDSIPAECIFEAPLRPDNDQIPVARGARSHTRLRRSTQAENSSDLRCMLTAKRQSSPLTLLQAHRAPELHTLPLQYHWPQITEILDDSPPALTSASASPTDSEFSPSAPGPAVRSKHLTWHRRPSTPFTPRDARMSSDSVRELIRFIRNEGGSHPARSLLPRNATGEYESVKELTRFVQLYSPDRGKSILLAPLDVDASVLANLRGERASERMHHTAPDSPIGETLHAGATREEIDLPATSADLDSDEFEHERVDLSGPDDAAIGGRKDGSPSFKRKAHPIPDALPSANPSDIMPSNLEILQPAVYQPSAAPKRKRPRSLERSWISSHDTERNAVTSTPPSSTSSVYRGTTSFDRRMKARQNTLKALEGRTSEDTVRPHTNKQVAPSISDNCTTASSIDTVDFFSKVIERDRKPIR